MKPIAAAVSKSRIEAPRRHHPLTPTLSPGRGGKGVPKLAAVRSRFDRQASGPLLHSFDRLRMRAGGLSLAGSRVVKNGGGICDSILPAMPPVLNAVDSAILRGLAAPALLWMRNLLGFWPMPPFLTAVESMLHAGTIPSPQPSPQGEGVKIFGQHLWMRKGVTA
ncbi:MAG: hypothetical protein COA84_07525 [Robiginitomaculum sp.]|nr:MAG: hypothetical protein COA84_07525 [Robiginitomaculum sp.]